MKLRPAFAALAALAALTFAPAAARAATCQLDACNAEIQAAAGLVVNDIFKDSNGNDAEHLPVYGKLINPWVGCPDQISATNCTGQSNPPYDCPGQYACGAAAATVATAGSYLATPDRLWWQPCRINDPNPVNVNGNLCPNFASGCVADDSTINYLAWQGLIFDLGGPSNKVAIFAENDHGPQPCESLEYTVYLSDNPAAMEQVQDPATQGVDPTKWNRAVLSKIYTEGWKKMRPTDPVGHGPTCGDTNEFSVEEDSFVQVFSLPCGITFRYTAIVAGNDGLDFPSCVYHSNEGEIDAIAGLTEGGAAVCPDVDGDHYVDCNCPGAPALCDCNDTDPVVHPGAPEACDATTDLNCDGATGTMCPAGLSCHQSLCLTACGSGENPYCPSGTQCQTTPSGNLCVPTDCGCAPGQVCVDDKCVAACEKVTCPGSQICQDGVCIDPCGTIDCPAGQQCINAQCVFPCGCYAGEIGCEGTGYVCDLGATDTCVPPACLGKNCPVGQICNATTGACESFCNANVSCPSGQKCVDPDGCVPLCQGVTCPSKWECDPEDGQCKDTACAEVTCFAPQVCEGGVCVLPDGGGSGGNGAGGKGGVGGEGGDAGGGSSSGKPDSGDEGSCGCRVPGEDRAPLSGALALSLLGVAAAFARRRRAH